MAFEFGESWWKLVHRYMDAPEDDNEIVWYYHWNDRIELNEL